VQAFLQEKVFVCQLITDVTASLGRSRDLIVILFASHTYKMRVLVADFLAVFPRTPGWGGVAGHDKLHHKMGSNGSVQEENAMAWHQCTRTHGFLEAGCPLKQY